YDVGFDTTPYTRESIYEVVKTLRDAIILVALVVLLFLQNWRSALIPLVAVPVAIIGTFTVMAALGFSLNNLTLFGLVLAIGIVVDDAIVVVEAVEHHIEEGLEPREATVEAMRQVSGPVIAVGLVLSAVFIPCAFITGILGQFFRQFALTIAVSTLISAFNSLTLRPALTALLLRPLNAVLGYSFRAFNAGFEKATGLYTRVVGRLVRVSVLALVLYGGLLGLTYYSFTSAPKGFIPNQDKGYLLVNVQLPDSASVQRTERVMRRIERIALATQGVKHTVGVAGQSILLNANAPNFGALFIMLDDFHKRARPDLSGDAIAARLQSSIQHDIDDGLINVFGAPPP